MAPHKRQGGSLPVVYLTVRRPGRNNVRNKTVRALAEDPVGFVDEQCRRLNVLSFFKTDLGTSVTKNQVLGDDFLVDESNSL